MARIRTIKPEFFTDGTIGECSPTARLLFVGMWVFADDGGNLDRSVKQLKAQIFPHDDGIDVGQHLNELISAKLVVEYERDGKKFLHIKNFTKHQRVEKPTYKFPTFDDESPTNRRLFDDSSPPEGKGREGNGKEGSTPLASRDQSHEAHNPVNGKVVCSIPILGNKEFSITESMVAEFKKLYPAVDVPQTLNEIRGWNIANPQNRKTASGIMRHINRWLAKEQNG